MWLLLLACAKTEPSAASESENQKVYLSDDVFRITDGMVLGTHNSYHQQPEAETVEEWNYSHPALDQQLDQGVRQFELDVQRDPETGNFRILHVPVLDPKSSCDLFADCLQILVDWSEKHPQHFPLQILIEPKTEIASWSFATDLEAWTEIDVLVRDIVGEKLYTPAEQQQQYASLRESVVSEGWATLSVLRGRMVFALLDRGEARASYTSNLTDIEGRTMFPLVDPDDDMAAYFLRDDPYDSSIPELVNQGFLIRTRGDAGLEADPERLEQAIQSGAHAISTDLQQNRWWMSAEEPVQCNPLLAVNCEASQLE